MSLSQLNTDENTEHMNRLARSVMEKICNEVIESGPNSKWPNAERHSKESIDRVLSLRSRGVHFFSCVSAKRTDEFLSIRV